MKFSKGLLILAILLGTVDLSTATTAQSNDVFISYRRDASGIVANSLFHLLDQAGVDAFYDIASIGAGKFGETIVSEIRRRPYFLLVLAPGTLSLFNGHRALHRVAPVTGRRPRIIALFSYAAQPGYIFSDHIHQRFFGRRLEQRS